MKPTSASVLRAMSRYNKWGTEKFFNKYSSGRRPRGHYLKYEGVSYPLKALWAAAHIPTIHTRDFQTANAAAGFKALGVGSSIYRKRPMEGEETEDEYDANDAAEDEARQRRARLATAPKMPPTIKRQIDEFIRNPDVIAEVLYRAEGLCETCGEHAPFSRVSDGTLYLEVHHIMPLAQGGEDTVENATALCPNCHRQAHFG